MKNILKLKIVFPLLLVGCFNLFAQQNLTLYNMEVVPQRMYSNPALFPSYSKINVGLPGISSIYTNVSNSGFKYSDLIKVRPDDSLYVDYDNMLKKLAKNNYLTTAIQVDLLSFGFVVKEKNYFSFNATEKTNIRFRYPKGLFEFIGKGNGDPDLLGKEVAFNFGLDATAYLEYGLGYSRKVSDKLTLGVKFKYLNGQANIWTEKSDISLTTDPTDFAITAKGNIKINTTGLDSSFTNNVGKNPSVLFNGKNQGIAGDLGGTYKLNEKWAFSASLIDLGFIKWKDPSIQTFQSHNSDAHFTYKGVDLNEFLKKNDTSSTSKDPMSKLTDSLTKIFEIDTLKGGSYKTKLSSQIYAGGNYYINEKTNAGLLFYGQFFDKKIHPGVSLSFNQRLGRWFNYSINYSVYNRSYTNVGLGFALNLGPVQFYTISDNIVAPLLVATKRDIQKNFHVHFGINLTMGRKLDKDKDGISDKKDKCPDVAGIKEFEGCPDKDHDHIKDVDDMCPNDSGSIELKGCPDRDKDKIIDLTDSCPDVFGLPEFDGCPDQDGDKIIDSKDSCPEQAGTPELKGCPDKDGDKIKDSDDACPDKPGPESNKGCPEATLNLINSKGLVLNSATVRKDGSYAFDYLPPAELAIFKLDNTSDTNVYELKVVVDAVARSVFKDTKDGLYRFKIETPVVPSGPKQEVAVKLEAKEAEILKKAFNNLEFNTGKDVIKPESYSSLDELAGLMVKKPSWKLKISGHTDNQGNPKANLTLSQKRAQAVKKYLVSKGVAQDRFKVEWFGGKKPIASNKTPEGRQKNRRVEMLIFE